MSRIDELLDIYRKQGAAQRDADIAASDNSYDTQKQQTQGTYDRQIAETKGSYEDLYRENAVQKLINEREIAENMANSGLTDSGLNRTQQTAVQLSYANSKNKIDTNRQKAVDTLASSLADAISKIDASKLSAAENIRSSYENAWRSSAQETYNNELEAETARQKAAYDYQLEVYKQQLKQQQEAAKQNVIAVNGGLLRMGHGGTLADKNVSVIRQGEKTLYIDNVTGKKTTLDEKMNPYTGTINEDTENGVFSNGYQPNNYKGSKLTVYDAKAVQAPNGSGNLQSVWRAKNGKYYVWNGEENSYFEVVKKNGSWVAK